MSDSPQVEVKSSLKKMGLTFEDRIAELKKTGTASQKTLISELEAYIEKMKPGQVIENDMGARTQYSLWLTIDKLLNKIPGDEFRGAWAVLLLYFNHHKKGVFGHNYVFRFAEHWMQSEQVLTTLQRLLNLIMVTCDYSNNQLKKVDMRRTVEEGLTEEARRRILGYYNS